MPHSSGGGSHGGGYHSSSFSSSSGSGSARSGGGSGPAVHPIRHVYYAGATRYVWYGQDGTCHTLYQKGEKQTSAGLGSTIGKIFVASIILLPLIWLFLVSAVFIPQPLDTSGYNANIVIEDAVGLTEGSGLEAALTEFRDKTGITPGVEIVWDESWSKNYSDVETFALSEYMRFYDDEKHWLVVLSWPQDAAVSSFVGWTWEGMIGDDCGSCINEKSEDAFTKIVQKHLLRATPETVGEELAGAYREFAATCMDKQISIGWSVATALLAALYIYLVFLFIRDYVNAKHLLKAVPVPSGAKERNCEYCGAMYISGTVSVCPRCGAPIPASQGPAEDEKKTE